MPTAVCGTCGYRLRGTWSGRNKVSWSFSGVGYETLCMHWNDPDPEVQKKVRELSCPKLWEAMSEAQQGR